MRRFFVISIILLIVFTASCSESGNDSEIIPMDDYESAVGSDLITDTSDAKIADIAISYTDTEISIEPESFAVEVTTYIEDFDIGTDEIYLSVGASYSIIPVISPSNVSTSKITLVSDNENVVKISGHTLTAVGTGNATIFAVGEWITKTCRVIVVGEEYIDAYIAESQYETSAED